MGQGCYFTHGYPFNQSKAAWVDIWAMNKEEEDERNGEPYDSDDLDTIYDNVGRIIESLGYLNVYKYNGYKGEDTGLTNNLFKIDLEWAPYNSGLIIKFSPNTEKYLNLAIHNFPKAELKVLRKLQKEGYKLRIATSGYTSTEVGQL